MVPDPERWARIQALFQEAVSLEMSSRNDFLDEACGNDRALRDEVEGLLAAEGGADAFLAGTMDAAVAEMTDPVTEGRVIGSYRVVRALGHGGMGAVYLAERADEAYQARVALKLVRGALASPELVARFQSERQILASLDHPNIARLLDGGATAEGTPYLVLEYVEGKPIDQYCDEARLDTRERLRLFRDLCEAVQYAHANLVVHRDIKPGNVLVDEAGNLKLLDFGIAKLLDPAPGETGGMETATGMRLLTPSYASPEQVVGRQVTVASDVYTLGVLLYQLLTGHLPYRFRNFGPDEVIRVVCESQPTRPSTVVTRPTTTPEGEAEGPTPAEIGHARRSRPERLRKALSGDLDTILLMALRKEPERRYASVQQFANDISRYLDGKTVSAQPDTWAYRTRMFVRRNTAGVAAAATILLLLIAFAVGMSIQTRNIAHERDIATLERDKATEVADYLVELFRVSDPGAVNPEDITARQILTDGAERIRTGLADQPLVRANLMNIIGEVYTNLGQFDSALALQREALAIQEAELGTEHIDLTKTLSDLATVERETGDYEAALVHFQRAHDIRLATLGPAHTDVAAAANNIAWVLYAQGDYEEALRLYQEAYDIYRADGGEPEGQATVAIGLSQTHQILGQFDQAEPLAVEVLAARRQQHGEVHTDVAEAAHNLGALYYEMGELDKADTLLRLALEMDTEIKGPDHPDVGAANVLMGRLLTNKGEFERAEPYFREALRVDRLALGEVHPDVAYDLNALARLLHRMEDYAEAERYYREAIAMYRETVPADNPYLAVPLINLADLMVTEGRAVEAEAPAREGLDITRQALPEGHRLTLQAEGTLGDGLLAQGRYEGAEPLLLSRLSGFREALGEDHSMTVHAREQIVALYVAMGRTDEAERYRSGG